MRGRRTSLIVLIAAVWLFIGLFFFSQMALLHPRTNRAFDSEGELVWELSAALIWAVSTPLIVWLSKRFRIEKKNWGRPLTIHFVIGIVLAFVQCAIHGLIIKAVFNRDTPLLITQLLPSFYYNIDKMVMVYWVIVLITHAYDYYQRFRQNELRAAQLEGQLAQAQLTALKMQLHPHFLFNTLNAISSLMHTDVEAADRMIVRLSDLLRLTLESSGKQMVSLKEEIDFLKRYVDIEQIRFQDRLTVGLNIAADTLDAQVPTLLLQPLVENAIRHGIAPRASAGHIEITAQQNDGKLLLRVEDDGVGIRPQGTAYLHEGLGLSNTRSRLEKLYGPSYHFELEKGRHGGVAVLVSFPFQLASEPASAASMGT